MLTHTHTHSTEILIRKSAIHGRANKLAAAHSVPAPTTKLVFPRRREAHSDRQTDNQEESRREERSERETREREREEGERNRTELVIRQMEREREEIEERERWMEGEGATHWLVHPHS